MSTRYQYREDSGYAEDLSAETLEGALEEAESLLREGYTDPLDHTTWPSAGIYEVDDNGLDEHVETVEITLHPEEPDCTDDASHDWQSPQRLVGGIKENPGLWGHGGGVYITEVCVRCGCRKTTDTWAQNPATGEQGLRSIEYEPGAYDLADLDAEN